MRECTKQVGRGPPGMAVARFRRGVGERPRCTWVSRGRRGQPIWRFTAPYRPRGKRAALASIRYSRRSRMSGHHVEELCDGPFAAWRRSPVPGAARLQALDGLQRRPSTAAPSSIWPRDARSHRHVPLEPRPVSASWGMITSMRADERTPDVGCHRGKSEEDVLDILHCSCVPTADDSGVARRPSAPVPRRTRRRGRTLRRHRLLGRRRRAGPSPRHDAAADRDARRT